MITSKDVAMLIAAMRSVFVTKDDLNRFASKDDLVSFKDEILKQIQDLRDDVAIVTGYRDMIEQHETDIEAIKKHFKLPSS